jgi:hypothetical protein
MTTKEKFITLFVVAIMVASFFILDYNSNKNKEREVNNINAILDTNVTVINIDSSKSTSIKTIEGLDDAELLSIQSKEIQKLQNLVDKYSKDNKKLKLRLAATFQTSTSLNIITPTISNEVNTSGDCEEVISSLVFSSTINKDKWINGTIDASRDNTIVKMKLYDEYELAIVDSITKRKRIPYGIITSKSPYDSVKEFRVAILDLPKSMKQPKWNVGITGGVGLGVTPFGRVTYGAQITLGINRSLIPLNFLK